ncbi:PriCT-2 domain-containing protein, partial [Bacteroides sp. GD17]|uniref:PriCT-2 domain-containing protein n=1 Tax=Bacteroides sp. GD17 TaxID=3139826 RepID=UPI00313BC754
MEPLSSLHLLTEVVRSAGADIAPTYQEYIQLTFAIANDCGEAGRSDFLTLCSLSPKYDSKAANKLFSNALKTGRNDVHIGTVFNLADLCGVKIKTENSSAVGTLGTQGSPGSSASHTRAREEDEVPDSAPR